MSKSRAVAKNSLFLFIDRVMRGFLLMVLTVWVARALGVKDFGVYSLAMTLAGIFRVITDFGVGFKSSYEIARNHNASNRIFSQGLVIKTIITLLGSLLLVAGARLFYPAHIQTAIWLAAAAYLISGYIEYANAIFGGQEKMQYISMSMVFYMGLVFLFVGFLLILKVRNVPALLAIQILASFLGLFFTAYLLIKKFKYRFVYPAIKELKQFAVQTVPFGLYFLSDVIYFHTDIILLSFLRGEQGVGLYQSAIKVIQFIEAAPQLFAGALFPTLSRIFASEPQAVPNMLRKSFKYLMFLGLPLAVGSIILGKEIMLLLFGQAYREAGPVFCWLAVMIPFRFALFLFGMALTACGGQMGRMKIVAIVAVLDVVLNLGLIPRWGLFGSATASVISAIVLALSLAYQMKKIILIAPLLKDLLHPVIGSAVMGLVVFYLKNLFPVWWVILIGAGMYGLIVTLSGGIKAEDWQAIVRLIRKDKNSSISTETV